MRIFVLAVTLLSAAAVHTTVASAADKGEWVSIIHLIANPERYDHKIVFLSAVATVEFENMSLCMSADTASSKDCLWLSIDDGPYGTAKDMARYHAALAKWQKLNSKRVSVRGTFSKDNTGHMGGWSGALEHITDVYPE